MALVTDPETGEAINLHRTWLRADGSGKAPTGTPRRLLKGHPALGVIRLWPDDETTMGLVIGEGIETCLTAAKAGIAPCWAAMTAGNVARFSVLPGLEGITVLVDHDRPDRRGRQAGIQSGVVLVERYAAAGFHTDRDVVIFLPGGEGLDVADLVKAAT